MKRIELIGAILIGLVVIGTPATVFAYQYVSSNAKCQTLVMRTYEDGNPTPNTVHVKKGQEACLRVTSYDVTHGFVISDLGIDAGAIHPGKWTEVKFVPQEVGTFGFVCSLRCSPMHSHVRGEIVVEE